MIEKQDIYAYLIREVELILLITMEFRLGHTNPGFR